MEPDAQESWVATFRDTLPELYAFISRRAGGERTLAEDVTQETWLRAVEAWRRRGPPREPLAWLTTTARNLLLNHFRDARRRPHAPADFAALELEGELPLARQDGALTPEAAALVQRGLAQLSRRDAALVEAFHLDGRSTRELAQECGASERAIEGRLRRARAKLRTILERSAP